MAQLDLTVTVGDKSTHVTACAANDPHAAVVVEYPNGNRWATIDCMPTPNGTLALSRLYIAPQSSGVGQHDASELAFDCTLTGPAGCDGVADVGVTLDDGTTVEAYETSSKSGTFTLDQFTADGHVSGSMDLTLSMGGTTVMIKGTFTAILRDCGPAGGQNYDPCTGRTG